MGLSITNKKGRGYPALICDACGLPIKDLGKGIAASPISGDGTISSVRIFHKVTCDPRNSSDPKQRLDQSVAGWMPLECFIPWLLLNHKVGKVVRRRNGVKLLIDVPEMFNL